MEAQSRSGCRRTGDVQRAIARDALEVHFRPPVVTDAGRMLRKFVDGRNWIVAIAVGHSPIGGRLRLQFEQKSTISKFDVLIYASADRPAVPKKIPDNLT